MLSERRDEDAATAFFKQAINNNGFPDKVFYVHWEIRVNYLRIYPLMRQNPCGKWVMSIHLLHPSIR
jgi:hypothetical protein